MIDITPRDCKLCDEDFGAEEVEVRCSQCGNLLNGADSGTYLVSATGIIHTSLCFSCGLNEETIDTGDDLDDAAERHDYYGLDLEDTGAGRRQNKWEGGL